MMKIGVNPLGDQYEEISSLLLLQTSVFLN